MSRAMRARLDRIETIQLGSRAQRAAELSRAVAEFDRRIAGLIESFDDAERRHPPEKDSLVVRFAHAVRFNDGERLPALLDEIGALLPEKLPRRRRV